MLRRPRVMRAIEQESKRLVRALGPQAIKVIKEILDDREHKDRLKAARTVLERFDPTVVGVQHQHHVDVAVESGVETALRMLQVMRELRVPIEVQREKIGVNLFEQITNTLDGKGEVNGNGKAPESESLMIEGAVVAAESDGSEMTNNGPTPRPVPIGNYSKANTGRRSREHRPHRAQTAANTGPFQAIAKPL